MTAVKSGMQIVGLYNGYIYSQKDNVVNFVKQDENPTSVKRADMLSFKTSNLLIIQVDKDAPRARDRVQTVSPDAFWHHTRITRYAKRFGFM